LRAEPVLQAQSVGTWPCPSSWPIRFHLNALPAEEYAF